MFSTHLSKDIAYTLIAYVSTDTMHIKPYDKGIRFCNIFLTILMSTYKSSLQTFHGPSTVVQSLKSLLRCPRMQYGHQCSGPSGPASYPALCLWPRKAVKDSLKRWDPASVWETQKRLLLSHQFSSSSCSQLGSASEDLPVFLLLSVYLTFQQNFKEFMFYI